MSAYPTSRQARDAWIRERRPARQAVDVRRPHGFFVEEERSAAGQVISVATVLLTNRECPWRCVMCDLWKTTVSETVPRGAIPTQIDYALEQLLEAQAAPDGRTCGTAPPVRELKLYNGGSFFDPAAIPPQDYTAIAARASRFERVIVECHPAFVRNSCVQFRDLLRSNCRLEVAMGLETVEPHALESLNKGMTLEQFSSAARFLARHEIALRAFVLVQPPFIAPADAVLWAQRSLDFAFECGAMVVSLIPTRAGNGAMEALAEAGEFAPPKLGSLEAAHDYGVGLRRGRVFADLWDLERFSECAHCFPGRRERLRSMNLEQYVKPRIRCADCDT